MREFWELVKDDHRQDPEALPWCFEMVAFSLILVGALTWIWMGYSPGHPLVAAMTAVALAGRYIARRWEP